jgi:hypothetical protein
MLDLWVNNSPLEFDIGLPTLWVEWLGGDQRDKWGFGDGIMELMVSCLSWNDRNKSTQRSFGSFGKPTVTIHFLFCFDHLGSNRSNDKFIIHTTYTSFRMWIIRASKFKSILKGTLSVRELISLCIATMCCGGYMLLGKIKLGCFDGLLKYSDVRRGSSNWALAAVYHFVNAWWFKFSAAMHWVNFCGAFSIMRSHARAGFRSHDKSRRLQQQ